MIKRCFWKGIVLLMAPLAFLFFLPPKGNLSENSVPKGEEPPFLHVYNWYGMIPRSILKEFEAETGITIRYDLYDNNEIVEAKLFCGNSGYDVVFPSASPYIQRQIQGGVCQKLQYDLLPNHIYVDPAIWEKMRQVDPQLEYSLPYYWGTFGFAYVEEEILSRLPQAPVTSYRMLFDPKVVSHFRTCGVTLLDESVDVYPTMMAYLDIDPRSDKEEDLQKAHENLMVIRPFISRFSSSRFVNELVGGESCLAQAWSGEAQMAQKQAEELGRSITIRYVVPEEGGILWIDAIVIPQHAPHPRNAHRFINFLLRPDVAARIANDTQLAIANRGAWPLIAEEIRSDPTIYPLPETLRRLTLDALHPPNYERRRTYLWTKIRTAANHPSSSLSSLRLKG